MSQERPAQNQSEVNYHRGRLRLASGLLALAGLWSILNGAAETSGDHTRENNERDVVETLIQRNPNAQGDLIYYEPYLTYQNENDNYLDIATGVLLLGAGVYLFGTTAEQKYKPESAADVATSQQEVVKQP